MQSRCLQYMLIFRCVCDTAVRFVTQMTPYTMKTITSLALTSNKILSCRYLSETMMLHSRIQYVRYVSLPLLILLYAL